MTPLRREQHSHHRDSDFILTFFCAAAKRNKKNIASALAQFWRRRNSSESQRKCGRNRLERERPAEWEESLKDYIICLKSASVLLIHPQKQTYWKPVLTCFISDHLLFTLRTRKKIPKVTSFTKLEKVQLQNFVPQQLNQSPGYFKLGLVYVREVYGSLWFLGEFLMLTNQILCQSMNSRSKWTKLFLSQYNILLTNFSPDNSW